MDRGSSRSSIVQRRRIAVSILCGVFFSFFTLAGCRRASGPAPASPTDIVVGVPEGNSPDAELGIKQFGRLLSFESLTNNGADGRPIPRLALKWQWENKDKRLRVFLRPGVSLHDGRSFTTDIALKLVRAAITDAGSVSGFPALADISSVSAHDDQLVFDLNRPSATLPEALTVPLDVGDNAVGTGPYRIVQESPTFTLQAFERYYLGRPTIDRVVVKSFDTMRTTWASLLRGELDMVYDVPADAVQFVRNDDVEVVPVRRWYQHLLALNLNDRRFRSPLVRKALNLAVNRDGIIRKVLHGNGAPSAGPVYPRYWAYDSSIAAYPFDPAQAAALLDAAGFPLRPGSAGAPPSRLRFTCLLPQNFTVWERIALEVQRDLFNVGIDMQFKVVPLREFGGLIERRAFEAVYIDMISGPTPARPYIWWGSARTFKGRYNVFGYENDAAEQLFETLLRSTNEAAVRSATSKLQRVFFDDPPALFLAWDARVRAINRRFVVDTTRDPVLTLWKWTVTSPRKIQPQ